MIAAKTTRWLGERDWRAVQGWVPIACVDVLPIREHPDATQIGLILRDTPLEGRKWCLIGGRLLRDETFAVAIRRQVHEALGQAADTAVPRDPQPLYVAQYMTTGSLDFGFDPRQHAIGLIFATELQGEVEPQGEAHDFRWFDASRLPSGDEIGFNQLPILKQCAARLATCFQST